MERHATLPETYDTGIPDPDGTGTFIIRLHAYSSEDRERWFVHTPGGRTLTPGHMTPTDALHMLEDRLATQATN